MAPTIVLVRHAQALHNVEKDYTLPDPVLSDLGIEQCYALATHLQQDPHIAQDAELIVVSPMRRTLQTVRHGLGWLRLRGVPVIVRGDWQENSDSACDTGTPVGVLAQEFGEFDFDTVFEEYPAKTGRWAFTEAAIRQRGLECLRWLRNRPEKVIIVVSHSAYLRVAICQRRFTNADYRVFDFAGDRDELLEWEMTDERGGGMGKSIKGVAYSVPGDFPTIVAEERGEERQATEEIVPEAPPETHSAP